MVNELQGMRRAVSELQRASTEAREERAAMQATITQLHGHSDDIYRLLQERLPGGHAVPNNEEREGEVNPDETVNREGPKYRRLELPLFDGEDPVGWTFKMERFFNVNGVPKTKRVDAAVVGLEGKALNWFQWLEMRALVTSWGELRQGVIRHFHATEDGDNYERLAGLKQSGTVLEFRERFEMISATLSDLMEETLMGLFMNGLAEEVKAEVRVLKPRTLSDIMDTASMVEG